MMPELVILISGRGSNMKAILTEIQSGVLKDKCNAAAVISNKKNAPGLIIAQDFGIETKVIASAKRKRSEYNKELLDYLKELNPDYIILAGYMKIISPEIIEHFHNRIINIHPADTIKHQGLHGYEWAWKNKLESTKVTVHFVDEGLDTGKIIGQKNVDLKGSKSLKEVEQRGLTVEHKFYSECLLKVLEEVNEG